jgi:tripartite-type tricarboxylate transporter receptor subunit TctC
VDAVLIRIPVQTEAIMFRLAIAATFAAWAITATLNGAEAQTAKSRTIMLVVPFPAGGPTDAIGRIVAEGMYSALGQTVIVENAPGATGVHDVDDKSIGRTGGP